MLDRQIQPEFKIISDLKLIKPEKHIAENKFNIYGFNIDRQDILKIEFIIEAGTAEDKNPLVPDMTNDMLNEGTSTRTAKQIAEEIDYYGSYLSLSIGRHYSYITLFCLTKYLEQSLPVVADIIQNPSFPKGEFQIVAAHQYQNFKINEQKTSTLAHDAFYKNLYGDKHPYGNILTEAHFKTVNPESLKTFHQVYYKNTNPHIIITGNYNDSHIKLIEKYFGNNNTGKQAKANRAFELPAPDFSQTVYIPKKDSVQCSIVMGNHTVNKSHPDYINLSIASVILGGYFGSRLMANIREDKGYTYGIHSMISTYNLGSDFLISAETGIEVAEKAVAEIRKELKIMQNELVSDKELNRVKNYLSGSTARKFDGIFAASSAFKSILLAGLDYDYYENYFKTIKNINAETVRQTAQKYFNPDTMLTIIAGKENNE